MDTQAFNESFKLIQLRFVGNLIEYLKLFEGLDARLRQEGGLPDDLEHYRNQIHKLAGSAKTFGFPELNSQASDVERLLVRIIDDEPLEAVKKDLKTALAAFLDEARAITSAHAPKAVEAAAPTAEAAPATAQEFDYNIVVVDDDELVRDLVKNGLSLEKCRITPAENGTSVLEYLEKTKRYSLLTKPDLIVLDVNMPDINGFEVLEKLKADPEFQAIPVTMLTRRNEDETVMKAFSSGAVDYITKPFEVPELASRIMSALKRQRRKVLIADDDELITDLLRHRFFLMGYTVLVARTGNEALARLRSEQPDIALIELSLSGMHGMDVLKQGKASRVSRNIPIVMLAETGEKENVIAALDSGAHDFIPKPFDIDELAARVAGILRRQSTA